MQIKNNELEIVYDGDIENGKFNFPNGITKIKSRAFSYCEMLKNTTIPNSVIRIGSFAFKNCSSLISMIIPNRVPYIDEGIFDYCTSLKTVKMPDRINAIRKYAFSNCKSLKSIKIPSMVTHIEYRAFDNCILLESITIPDNTIFIGKCAFINCISLKKAIIPKSVTFIGRGAFQGCSELIIYGVKGSYAHFYANDYDILFVEIEEDNDEIIKKRTLEKLEFWKIIEKLQSELNGLKSFTYDQLKYANSKYVLLKQKLQEKEKELADVKIELLKLKNHYEYNSDGVTE